MLAYKRYIIYKSKLKIMINQLIFLGLLLPSMFFIIGCGTPIKETKLSNNFFENRGKIGIVLLTTNDFQRQKCEFYRIGGQGLLDMAISNAATADLRTCLDRQLKVLSIVEKHYITPFSGELDKRGFEVVVLEDFFDHSKLKKIDDIFINVDLYFYFYENHYDYQPITDELQVDYLLTLEIIRFGVARNYYGFIPTGNPKGWAALRSSFIDARTNELIAQQFSNIYEPVSKEWDQPPDYKEVVNAVISSFEKSADECYEGFFGDS